MASLAPGNGWFPHRNYPSRSGGYPARRRAGQSTGNVYAFPGHRLRAPSGPAIATKLAALLVADSVKAGRSATWVLGWCFFGLVAASLVWLGLTGLLAAAALLFGVPWITVAIAATAVHVLGATLALLMGLRIGRGILASVEKRNELLGKIP